MNYQKLFFICSFMMIGVLVSCKKDKAETSDIIKGDTLSEVDNEFLKSISISKPNLKDMVGLDGNPLGKFANTSPVLNTLVKSMLIKAQQFSELKETSYAEEGADQPQHYGLVYSFGQRNLKERLKPLSGNELHQKYSVIGTDGSGLMINLLKHGGINISNCTVSTFEATLKNALKDHPEKIELENKDKLAFAEIKSGDIIYWLHEDLNHIGMVGELKNGNKIIFQSNGNGNPKNEEEQLKNLELTRGVHAIDLKEAIKGNGHWSNYKILRLNIEEDTSTTVEYSTITDSRDGEMYKIVKIGTQTWFAENLRYSSGIDKVESNGAWAALYNNATRKPAWCYYDNNVAFHNTYGKLYNWHAVSASDLCPDGWHIPTDDEWDILTDYLGGKEIAGGKMKSKSNWDSPNLNATNESGFSGTSGGYRYIYEGTFRWKGSNGFWWSSTSNHASNAKYRSLIHSVESVGESESSRDSGFSCRCIKD
ncbi:MAG TPA: FISUMP domain-containing protein [Chitinophagales bacterium]|nr:FISUMP domain-containing protein [Chitinophagales bacterium]